MATLNTLDRTTFKDIGKPILIASHPRSGTHLTIDLLRKQFAECHSWKRYGESLARLYFALESFAPINKPLSENIALNILSRAKRPIIKTHCDPQFSYLLSQKQSWVYWLKEEADIYYVFRDGRDVMCSLHLFMQSYDPTTRCSLSEFMQQKIRGVSRVKNWANHIQTWLSEPKVKALKFEDIIKNPHSALNTIGQDLQLTPLYKEPLLPKRIESIWHSRWLRLTQRQSESTAIIGYYGGQQVQKWQTTFTAEDRHFFNSEAGDMLLDLGYEKSDIWV
ncbi:MAG: sulfotransferase domain-containing protein [Xenococcaceae cyanobacterium]